MNAVESYITVKPDIEVLRNHLQEQYAGIFDADMIQRHIDEYIGLSNAHAFASFLIDRGHVGQRMLDIGSGYGSIVLTARQAGINALGIEMATFEIDFARARLHSDLPSDEPELVYRQGDALDLPFAEGSFDLVTILNVIEHVPDYRLALAEAIRVLKPDGHLYIICPNYAAFRREAHYLVPWLPLLPRSLASTYLKCLGRDPAFFEQHIHYCSYWGVLRTLRGLQLDIEYPYDSCLSDFDVIRRPYVRRLMKVLQRARLLGVVRIFLWVHFLNPLRPDINICAIKRRNA